MADSTLTLPQTLVLRYKHLEAPERRIEQVAEEYRRWFLGRRGVALSVFEMPYCCGSRFTAAGVAVGYAIKLAIKIGLEADLPDAAKKYWSMLKLRPAYRSAVLREKDGDAARSS